MAHEYFIAKKIFQKETEGKKVSRPIVRISIISIALAIVVNLLTIAVVIGFQKEVREKMSLNGKGKVKSENHKKKIKLSNCKYVYSFISPEGVIVETIWYSDFCKENNLNCCKIREVARGVRLQHKGWKVTRRPRTEDDK